MLNSAIKSDGSCWTWGHNFFGKLGDNTDTNKSSPILVVGSHSFVEICPALDGEFALKSDGACWAWGLGVYGQLGDNTTANKSSPVLVVGSHSFVKINGGTSVLALKNDGSCWSWGANDYGGLGDNTILQKSSPVLVVGNHSFVDIAIGGTFSKGLKADGSCWSWGFNDAGQLGDNTTANKSSPVLVVGNHSFISISGFGVCAFTIGLKADGSCWGWGYNWTEDSTKGGMLGDNTTTDRSSPVLVVGNHSFIKISSGTNHTLALKSDGSCWAWGSNEREDAWDPVGCLGTNDANDRSSPVLVVGSHSFIDIKAARYTSIALKADGSCWSWGYNEFGQLGDGTITNRSSPVLVVGNHSFISFNTREPLLKHFYKTASTEAGIATASWQAYENPFSSLGYVKLRVEV